MNQAAADINHTVILDLPNQQIILHHRERKLAKNSGNRVRSYFINQSRNLC